MRLIKRSDGIPYAPATDEEVNRFMSLIEPARTRVVMVCILLRDWGHDPYVIEAYRTTAQQRKKVLAGTSKTMASAHCKRLAADIVSLAAHLDGKPWDNTPVAMRRAIGRAARIAGMYWGGRWLQFGPYGDWAHVEWRKGEI